jgi:hypothetical protein
VSQPAPDADLTYLDACASKPSIFHAGSLLRGLFDLDLGREVHGQLQQQPLVEPGNWLNCT